MPRPRHVLDIGTGIGLWARYSSRLSSISLPIQQLTQHSNMSDAHPTTQILGTDLSPTWHDDIIRPNLSLEVDDCCSNWTYLDEGRDLFDLVHIRCLYGSIKDWKRLYQQTFDHLEPGRGYIEQAELSLIPHFYYTVPPTAITTTKAATMAADGIATAAEAGVEERRKDYHGFDESSNSVFAAWYNFWKECSEKTGKTWLIADSMADLIYEVGFENVREVRYILPLVDSPAAASEFEEEENLIMGGGYPDYPISRLRDIKKWFRQFWETGMEGWVLAVSTRYMGVCFSLFSFSLYVC